MFTKYKPIAAVCLAVLLMLAQGCNLYAHLPGRQTREPKPSTTQLPAAQETGLPVQTQVDPTAATTASSSPNTLEFSEAQLNQLVSQQLSGSQQIRNLHVTLSDGTLQVSGEVNQNGLALPLTINLTVAVDAQGRPHARFLSGKAGIFPLPQSILNEISVQVDQIIQNELNAAGDDLFVDSFVIEDGRIKITAHVRTS